MEMSALLPPSPHTVASREQSFTLAPSDEQGTGTVLVTTQPRSTRKVGRASWVPTSHFESGSHVSFLRRSRVRSILPGASSDGPIAQMGPGGPATLHDHFRRTGVLCVSPSGGKPLYLIYRHQQH